MNTPLTMVGAGDALVCVDGVCAVPRTDDVATASATTNEGADDAHHR
jgi:hypothetical protein